MTTNQRNICKLIIRAINVIRKEEGRKFVHPTAILTLCMKHNVELPLNRIYEYLNALTQAGRLTQRNHKGEMMYGIVEVDVYKTVDQEIKKLHDAYVTAEVNGDYDACERLARELNELQSVAGV